ncbi:MAG TPA: penicillin-binding protein activator LpoB [Longimicrobiaceae bacterium]|nr:penicillin-binding protein activator LpoB [Longimicrobiaceae bacterium]
MKTHVSLRRAGTLLLTLLALGATGCARTVTRMAPEQAIDLSGRWNDVDSRLVAEEMIRQSFESQYGANWAMRYSQAHGGQQPTVIVGTIRNRSMEHIPVGTFVRDLEHAYVNSGIVNVVASRAERGEVREEREDQQEHATADSRARLGREMGAQYMLQGDIQSIEDRERGKSVVFYQVDMTLVDLESNAKVWVGQHKIKKFIERPRLGF